MDEYPRRRRRLEEPERPGGGIPIFPLIIVVIFAGLLLGGVLAHFFGSKGGPPASTVANAPVVTPVPSAAPTVSAGVVPSPNPSSTTSKSASTPKPASQPSASSRPSEQPSQSQQPKRTIAASPSSTPVHSPTVVFVTPNPQSSAKPLTPSVVSTPAAEAAANGPADRASAVVRSYLSALARGDHSTATSYLESGEPSETFMSSSARITSVSGAPTDDGKYKVNADIMTAQGEYFETFVVENGPNGLQITDHYAIKPQ